MGGNPSGKGKTIEEVVDDDDDDDDNDDDSDDDRTKNDRHTKKTPSSSSSRKVDYPSHSFSTISSSNQTYLSMFSLNH